MANFKYHTTMTHLPKQRKILSLKGMVQPQNKPLEYRLIWNEANQEWDIHRNGQKTGLARRKKQSAIDRAMLAIRSDGGAQGGVAKIISMKDRVLTTEWEGTVPLDRPEN